MSNTPRRRNPDQTRERILEAARALFVEQGYEAVTVRKVAARVGISHGTIYLYFRDKDDLLVQVSEEQFGRLLIALRRVPRTREPEERLVDALRELARFGVANPHEYYLMMGLHAAIVERRDRTDWAPTAERVANVIRDLANDVLPSTLADDDRRRIATNMTASISGLVAFAHGGGANHDAFLMSLDLHIDMLLHGCLAAGSSIEIR